MLGINTQPVSFSFMVFDPQDATNRPLFSDLFENGISFMGTATLQTTIAGLTGFYGIRALYSSREGPDFSEVIRPPGTPVNTKQGSYYVGASFQQYLIQDPSNPAKGWGVFGEITTADGNPNPLEWSTHVGIGGTALIPGRPVDRFGIAYFRFGFSSVLKNAVAPVFHLKDESGVEVFYNVAVTPWFRITANLQFIRPASGNWPEDIFAGLGTYVRF
jgi:porin